MGCWDEWIAVESLVPPGGYCCSAVKLHQVLIGITQISHSPRKHFGTVRNRELFVSFKALGRYSSKQSKFCFLPCVMKAQSSGYSWARENRKTRWLCTLPDIINQYFSVSWSPKAILADDRIKVLSKLWIRFADHTTGCTSGHESVSSCFLPRRSSRILWEKVMARSQM